jgi:short-subunit dehydrogenase
LFKKCQNIDLSNCFTEVDYGVFLLYYKAFLRNIKIMKDKLSRVVLITGASTGIGAAIALILANKSKETGLILTARDRDKLELIADRCRELGAEVAIVTCNLAEVEQVQKLATEAIALFGKVDALINNAGYGQMGPLELISPQAAQEQFAVNFHAPLILSQALIPHMRKQGGGRIINISSLGGRIPFPAAGLYSCSKFALEAMSDVLRMELKAFNIQVSIVEPGPVVTDFFEAAWEKIKQNPVVPKQTPYDPVFEKIQGIDRQVKSLGWTPERVAEVIIQALNACRPRPRYVAATGGKTLIFLMTKILPTWVRDEFWKRFYGIDKVEKEWKLSRK